MIAELIVTRATALPFGERSIEAIAGLRGALEIVRRRGPAFDTAIRSANNLLSVIGGYSAGAAEPPPRLLELAERIGSPIGSCGRCSWRPNWRGGVAIGTTYVESARRMEELASSQMWLDIIGSCRAASRIPGLR